MNGDFKRQTSQVEHQGTMKTQPLATTTLDLPPSCIAFVPSHPTKFLVGTYHLRESGSKDDSPNNRRDGSLSLFELVDDGM